MTKEEIYILWNKFAPLWKSWARKLSYVHGEVEDLYQESYLLLLGALQHYDDKKGVPFEAYYKMVLYRWGKRYSTRQKATLMEDQDLEWSSDDIGSSFIDMSKELIHKEDLRRLMEVLELLSPLEQIIIRRFYFEEKTLKEISIELGLALKNVATRKGRALKKLNEIF